MFSFAKTDDALFEIKKALSAYFAKSREIVERRFMEPRKERKYLGRAFKNTLCWSIGFLGYELPDCDSIAKR